MKRTLEMKIRFTRAELDALTKKSRKAGLEVTAISVGGGGVGVHDQLLHGPVVLQSLAELGGQAGGPGVLPRLSIL